MFRNLPVLAARLMAPTPAAGGQDMSTADMLLQLLPFVLIIVVFYFILIRPQRKRDKADEAMRNNLEVGDIITTRGGIVGKVTNIKDDQITIQSGSDSVKIRIMRWAVARKEEKISD